MSTQASTSVNRSAEVRRDTLETQIRVRIDLDGTGRSQLSTGIGFFDHMLDQVARHGMFDIEVEAKGDLAPALLACAGVSAALVGALDDEPAILDPGDADPGAAP